MQPDLTAGRNVAALCLLVAVLVITNFCLSTLWRRQEKAEQWLWASVVTPTSFELRVKGGGYLVVGPSGLLDPGSRVLLQQLQGSEVNSISVTGLTPNTEYYYGLVDEASQQPADPGRVRTWATGHQPTTRVALASCSTSESNHPVFDEIADAKYDLFLHMGDMHYHDIQVNDTQVYRDAFALVHGSPRQRRLFRSAPVAYVWDDHDFGGNDVGAEAPSAGAARAALRECVPKPEISDQPWAAYHAFSVGRARFVMVDARSESTVGGSIMSEGQMQWLLGEIANASAHKLLILMLGQPWIGEAEVGAGGWPGHASDRRRISEAIAAGAASGGYANVLGVSGDAHMLAFDDGSHTDYSAAGRGAGFPLLQAAPLHRSGSAKGGPYTTECMAYRLSNNHQYGSLEITDTGEEGPDAICVRVRMHRSGGQVLHEEHFCGPMVGDRSSKTVECSIPLLPAFDVALLVGVLLTAALEIVVALFWSCRCKARRQIALGWFAVLLSAMSYAPQVVLFVLENRWALPLDDPWRPLLFQLIVEMLLLGYLILLPLIPRQTNPQSPMYELQQREGEGESERAAK